MAAISCKSNRKFNETIVDNVQQKVNSSDKNTALPGRSDKNLTDCSLKNAALFDRLGKNTYLPGSSDKEQLYLVVETGCKIGPVV